jgi:predicted RNA binding protein YcfA (HicA-like mRNA interferase family)
MTVRGFFHHPAKELPALRAGELARILEKAGFERWRQKGSRLTM